MPTIEFEAPGQEFSHGGDPEPPLGDRGSLFSGEAQQTDLTTRALLTSFWQGQPVSTSVPSSPPPQHALTLTQPSPAASLLRGKANGSAQWEHWA